MNQKILASEDSSREVTLFDLCLQRKYKSGISFLMNKANVQAKPEQ